MEIAYREHGLLMANTTGIIRASRDILTGINRENMKRLGEWGFSVEASTTSSSKSKVSSENKTV